LNVKCRIKRESNIYALERILGIGLPSLELEEQREASRKKFRLEDYRMAQAADSDCLGSA